MRTLSLFGVATLLAAAPVAAGSDLFDADLMNCAGLVHAMGAIDLFVQSHNQTIPDNTFMEGITPLDVDAPFAAIGLVALAAEQGGCVATAEQALAAFNTVQDPAYNILSTTLETARATGDETEFRNLWEAGISRLSCLSVLTDGDIERGRQILVEDAGYPCGWQS